PTHSITALTRGNIESGKVILVPSGFPLGGNMLSSKLDSTINSAVDLAQNFGFDKLLQRIGLDPSNVTFDSVVHHILDFAVANITTANLLALAGALFYVATLMMRTIVPLRVIGIISITFFIAYGVVAGAVGTFLLYLFSLPVNVIRLRQMLTLVK